MSKLIAFSDTGDQRIESAIKTAKEEIKKITGQEDVSDSEAIRTILIEYVEKKTEKTE
jgi:hypothetical protein